MELFISCAIGLEPVLADEITALGLDPRPTKAGVSLETDLEHAYRICLWSRVASRVLIPLMRCGATGDELYEAASELDWSQHLAPGALLAIDFSGQNKHIRHTRYGALRLKDAIADWFEARDEEPPRMDKEQFQMRLSARLTKGVIEVALDFSGEGLHRRGYRERQGQAPLRENLAAALLYRAGWPKHCETPGAVLYDPMCGSGTFLIEAGMMATDCAPGLRRDIYGFKHWPQHDNAKWSALIQEAEERFRAGRRRFSGSISGSDSNKYMVRVTRDNASRAGLHELIDVQSADASALPTPEYQHGLVMTNPPYGERLGEEEQVAVLFEVLGKQLREKYLGWDAAILSANLEFGRRMGMHSHKQYKVSNGKLACALLLFSVKEDNFLRSSAADAAPSEGAKMVANRIKKNMARINSWLARENIQAYRTYDADLPEYAAAVDLYQTDAGRFVVVQEYAPPKTIDAAKARHRLNELVTGVGKALAIPREDIIVKTRDRQRGTNQYEPEMLRRRRQLLVQEGSAAFDAAFEVNLEDYLDTGLFLDHRPMRREIARLANGKRFLNLFCYTATVTVAAALAGAKSSLSLDMSNTYLEWAERNFLNNRLEQKRHRLERADCLVWLKTQSLVVEQKYDLIFLDPPSFSNSKKMDDVLDIQQDHVRLIEQAMRLLEDDGLLIFSTNLRKFKMDVDALSAFDIEDRTAGSLDPDFQRNQRIHQVWNIRPKPVTEFV